MSINVSGEDPILFDMGTGLRYFGLTQPTDGTFRGSCLLTHLHWDHAQGLPFFKPILCPGARLDIYGPVQEDGRHLADAVRSFLSPPHFPVPIEALPGQIVFHDLGNSDIAIGRAEVRSRLIPHVGNTLGYRVTINGVSIAYLPDHQQPMDGTLSTVPEVMELIDGVDLLIHDAQYTPAEFAVKRDWGHCTPEYALWLAAEAHVGTLALFHHDPVRDDRALDDLTLMAQRIGEANGFDVFAAAEGMSFTVRPGA